MIYFPFDGKQNDFRDERLKIFANSRVGNKLPTAIPGAEHYALKFMKYDIRYVSYFILL